MKKHLLRIKTEFFDLPMCGKSSRNASRIETLNNNSFGEMLISKPERLCQACKNIFIHIETAKKEK